MHRPSQDSDVSTILKGDYLDYIYYYYYDVLNDILYGVNSLRIYQMKQLL